MRTRATLITVLSVATMMVFSVGCDAFLSACGNIQDSNGNGIEGARITVDSDSPYPSQCETDSDGCFNCGGNTSSPHQKTVKVVVVRDGYKEVVLEIQNGGTSAIQVQLSETASSEESVGRTVAFQDGMGGDDLCPCPVRY